ncbi:hypothetical protein ACFL6U_22650 [Planctomycetota bacterium]
MQAIVDGVRCDTKTAAIIHEWPNVTLYRAAGKRFLFMHYHGWDPERIEAVAHEDAVELLQTKGDPMAVDLLYESAD